MEQVIRQDAASQVTEAPVPGVSWAAVVAGAIASLALTLLLLSFGAGMDSLSFHRGPALAFLRPASKSAPAFISW